MNVQLNDKGNILAFTVYDNVERAKRIKIYAYDSKWKQIDNNILMQKTAVNYGNTIALNNNGNILALSVCDEHLNSSIHIYVYNGNTWTDKVSIDVIDYEYINYMQLNSIGDKLLIGLTNKNDGEIIVYNNENNKWNKYGNNIRSNLLNDGSVISLVDNGERFICGGVDDNNMICIKSYKYVEGDWSEENSIITFENNEKSLFSLSADIEGKNMVLYRNNNIQFYRHMLKKIIIS